MTYRDILRAYAEGIDSGQFDRHIAVGRQRKFVALVLRTLSNDGAADQPYRAATSDVRDAIIRRFTDAMWQANVGFFVEVASPSARALFGQAVEQAITIAREV